jgi:hypothetical protein
VHFAGGLCHYFSIYIFCAVLRKQKKLAHFGDSQPANSKKKSQGSAARSAAWQVGPWPWGARRWHNTQ